MKDGKRKLAHKLLIEELRFDETDLENQKVNWLNQSKNNVKEKELNQVVPNDENLPIASSSNQNLKNNEVVPESSGLNNKEPSKFYLWFTFLEEIVHPSKTNWSFKRI